MSVQYTTENNPRNIPLPSEMREQQMRAEKMKNGRHKIRSTNAIVAGEKDHGETTNMIIDN